MRTTFGLAAAEGAKATNSRRERKRGMRRPRECSPLAPRAVFANRSRSERTTFAAILPERPRLAERLPLELGDPGDPGRAEVEQPVQLLPAERRLLAGPLHLDELPGPGHDQVQVHL